MRRLTETLFDRAVIPVASRVLRSGASREAPLPPDLELLPWVTGARYGMSHFNVVIPDLPEPHRYLACMILIGQSGMRVFDLDDMIQDSPRNTATVANGTAVNAADGFRVYAVDRDCELRADGTLLRFGDDLEIAGTFPTYRMTTRRPELEIDLELTCTNQITWFARSTLYDHLGFPARYHGEIRWNRTSQPIDGICSFEHARAASPDAILDRPVPARLKLPWDFFSYQVLALPDDTLLMLARVEFAGRPGLTGAYLRQLDGEQGRWTKAVDYKPLGYHDTLHVAPDGGQTRVANRFRWSFTDPVHGPTDVEVTGDTPLHFGVGTGWIGGAHYTGTHRGHEISGRGYYEYADRRGH